MPSSQICNTFRTQVFSLLLGSSGSRGFIRRTSSPIFRPSFVMHNILSSDASTMPECTLAARSLRFCTISFWSSEGFATTVSNVASGTGRWSWSLVLMSATSLNIFMSSGRLKNLAKRVLAR